MRLMTMPMITNQRHRVWGQTPPKEGGYVTAQRQTNSANISNYAIQAIWANKGLSRTTQMSIKTVHRLDRFPFLLLPQIRYSRR